MNQQAQMPADSGQRPDGDEPIPVMQEIYDNIWFLFLVSGVIVLVSYIIWSLIDLVNRPTLP
ncbi:MAG: hypothetical protein HY681_13780 [Chloroflexi bacterium]|nr:hypothetical protein [Chloroflexota bacterium]